MFAQARADNESAIQEGLMRFLDERIIADAVRRDKPA